jgi:DNA repair exonuclease SbcCD nuclease subunit
VYEAGYNSELWLEPALLPQFTSYNALGHIHLSQQVKGAGKPTWYAGAPDRMNLGERSYTPQVLLVETPDTAGGAASVRPIPLTTCTPFVQETLRGMDEVGRLCDALTRAVGPDPLGQVTISDVDVASRAAVEARIRLLAPRLEVRWPLDGAVQIESVDEQDPHDVRATVAGYLERTYANREDQRRRLMDAFSKLWNDTSGVA